MEPVPGIVVTNEVVLPENELKFSFVRASGPGGQNVNKVASAVQLRFDIRNSPALSREVKDRLIKLAGSRVTEDGVMIIEARRYRTQEQNRFDATQRLVAWIRKALEKPKTRKATRPTVTAKAARMSAKRKRGEVKHLRQYIPEDWE